MSAHPEQLAKLFIVGESSAPVDDLRTQSVALRPQTLDLTSSIKRGSEPAEQIPDRLEDKVRSVLDWAQDSHCRTPDRVERPPVGRSECDRQQDERSADEQRKHNPPAAYLSIAHGVCFLEGLTII
jgi:hypothetical protein